MPSRCCLTWTRGQGSQSGGYHTLLSLRELGRRAQFLDGQLARPDVLIIPLVTARAPRLLTLYGVGPDTAMLLIAAGDHPGRSLPKPWSRKTLLVTTTGCA